MCPLEDKLIDNVSRYYVFMMVLIMERMHAFKGLLYTRLYRSYAPLSLPQATLNKSEDYLFCPHLILALALIVIALV